MYRAILISVILTLALVTAAPTTSASEPECIQVYPWSKVCDGSATPEEVACYLLYREYKPNCIEIQD